MTARGVLLASLCALLPFRAAEEGVLVVWSQREPDPRIDSAALAAAFWLESAEPALQQQLAETLEPLVERVERATNPLVADLDEVPFAELVHDVQARYASGFNTLATVAEVSTGAGVCRAGVCLRLAARCPTGARCMPLAEADETTRLVLWPFAAGLRVQCTEHATQERAVAALRAASVRSASFIGWAWSEGDGEPGAGSPLVPAAARAVLQAAPERQPLPRWLTGLAAPAAASRPWLPPTARAFVAPRLSRLADRRSFEQEVQTVLQPLGCEGSPLGR